MAQALRAGLRNGGLRRGGLRPGLGNGSLFAIAPLDLFFARNRTLDPRVTFTRASSGTYVGSDGLIKTATTNLLLQSNGFDTTWSNTGSTETAAAGIAPDGTNSAWLLTDNTNNTNHNIFQSVLWAAATYTFSMYAKYSTHRWLGVRIGGIYFGSWDLQNGVVGSVTSGASISMQSLADGWYRLVLTGTLASGGYGSNLLISLNNADAVTLTAYTGTGTSALIWGAQLEQSSTVGEYIPTTSTINSAPRFDHNPTTGESLGLLVEEQRTNLNLQSESFNTTWTAGAVTVTANSVASPDGLTTADTITADGTTAFHLISQSYTLSATSYAYSVFAKKNTEDIVVIRAFTAFGGQNATFNLTSGTVTAQNSSTATIQSFGNGWYRCTMVFTSLAATSSVGIYLNSQSSQALSTSLYLWGAQLEAGAFPTSYIPTTTATVTRSADVASISGSNFSSWYRQDEGTVFAETQLPAGSASNVSSRSIIDVTDGTTSNRFSLRGLVATTTSDQLTLRSGGSTVAQVNSNGSAVSNAVRRLASAVKLDDYAIAATGSSSAVTDISGAMPISVNQARIGAEVGSTEVFCGTIRRLTYWPARLSNSVLQTLTQ